MADNRASVVELDWDCRREGKGLRVLHVKMKPCLLTQPGHIIRFETKSAKPFKCFLRMFREHSDYDGP